MAKQIAWSMTDLEKLSYNELYEEFKYLLLFFISKREVVFRTYRAQGRYPGFVSNTPLFGFYYIDGLNILKKHGDKRKRIPPQIFLENKFSKDDLIKGILQLRDYPYLINILENKGTATDITTIVNSTIRREALLFYGIPKFFTEMKAKIVDERNKEQLLLLHWHKNEEPLMMVKVIDSTTKDVYLLRVPPDMKTVKEAVAWTFNMEKEDYRPSIET